MRHVWIAILSRHFVWALHLVAQFDEWLVRCLSVMFLVGKSLWTLISIGAVHVFLFYCNWKHKHLSLLLGSLMYIWFILFKLNHMSPLYVHISTTKCGSTAHHISVTVVTCQTCAWIPLEKHLRVCFIFFLLLGLFPCIRSTSVGFFINVGGLFLTSPCTHKHTESCLLLFDY